MQPFSRSSTICIPQASAWAYFKQGGSEGEGKGGRVRGALRRGLIVTRKTFSRFTYIFDVSNIICMLKVPQMCDLLKILLIKYLYSNE